MKSDQNGVSSCLRGQENYKSFTHRGKKFIQYDFRTDSGALFSCVAPDLKTCREKRDNWIIKNTEQ